MVGPSMKTSPRGRARGTAQVQPVALRRSMRFDGRLINSVNRVRRWALPGTLSPREVRRATVLTDAEEDAFRTAASARIRSFRGHPPTLGHEPQATHRYYSINSGYADKKRLHSDHSSSEARRVGEQAFARGSSSSTSGIERDRQCGCRRKLGSRVGSACRRRKPNAPLRVGGELLILAREVTERREMEISNAVHDVVYSQVTGAVKLTEPLQRFFWIDNMPDGMGGFPRFRKFQVLFAAVLLAAVNRNWLDRDRL